MGRYMLTLVVTTSAWATTLGIVCPMFDRQGDWQCAGNGRVVVAGDEGNGNRECDNIGAACCCTSAHELGSCGQCSPTAPPNPSPTCQPDTHADCQGPEHATPDLCNARHANYENAFGRAICPATCCSIPNGTPPPTSPPTSPPTNPPTPPPPTNPPTNPPTPPPTTNPPQPPNLTADTPSN